MSTFLLKRLVISIYCLSLTNLAFAEGHRTDDTSILDIDASGEVDAMTDGLLMMRSMFGFTDDVLVNGAVAENCAECDPAQIQEHISMVKGMTISQLNSAGEPGPAGPQGEKGEKGDKGDTGPAGPAGPAGALDSSLENVTIENLSVTGITSLDDLAVGGITTIENELSVMGPSVLMGPTIVEDELRVMGPLRSDYLDVTGPSTLESLNVMSDTQLRELRVRGPALFDHLDVMGFVTLGEQLRVEGSTRLKDLEIEGANGALLKVYREGSISPNNVEVGTEGLLEVTSPATFQNNLEVTGTTTFKGSTTFEGPTTLTMAPDEQFSVEGSTALNELNVMGPSSLIGPTVVESELRVMGPARLDHLNVMGDAFIENELRVFGPMRSDFLDVMGNTNLGNLSINGSIQVTGPDGNLLELYREGSITPNNIEVGSEGLLNIDTPVTLQKNLEVKGATTFEGSTQFFGPTTLMMGPEEKLSVEGLQN